MSTMVTAGPPAHPGHAMPRLVHLPAHPDGDTPTAADATHREPTADLDHAESPGAEAPHPTADLPAAFARLTASGTFRVPSPDPTDPQGGDADWHDADPHAGRDLGDGRTPYDRAVHRWKEGTSRDRARTKFRMMKRLLTGDMNTPVTADDLRAYPWHQLTVEDAEDYHRAVTRHYTTQSSRNDMICVLRAVVRQCYKVGLVSALRHELLLEALYTVAPGRSTRRHRITDTEFDALVDACLGAGDAFARARNTAIVALFRTTGLRVSELVGIDLADWDRRHDCIHLPLTKNTDTHVLFLHPATKALLEKWVDVRGTRPGKLFCSSRGPIDRALSPEAIRLMLTTRCKIAGITHFATHDFRRTFATEMLRQFDAALVSKLLNHRKLASTLIYDMSTDDEMRDAVRSINLTSRLIGGAA